MITNTERDLTDVYILLSEYQWVTNKSVNQEIVQKVSNLEKTDKKDENYKRAQKVIKLFRMIQADSEKELKKAYKSLSKKQRFTCLEEYLQFAPWNESGREFREEFLRKKFKKINTAASDKHLKLMDECKTYSEKKKNIEKMASQQQIEGNMVYTSILPTNQIKKGLGLLKDELKNWQKHVCQLASIANIRCMIDREQAFKIFDSAILINRAFITIKSHLEASKKELKKEYGKINIFVARGENEQGPLQGIAFTKMTKKNNCELELLFANPRNLDCSARAFKGAGSALITHIAIQAMQNNCPSVKLENTSSAVEFYKKLGFVESKSDSFGSTVGMRLYPDRMKQLKESQHKNHLIK